MTEQTPKQVLVDVLLEDRGGLNAFVLERRLRIRPVAWEAIASEIGDVTDGRVTVTGTSLQKWFRNEDADTPGSVAS